MSSAEVLAQALNAKPAGKGKWRALCPSHSEKTPSFSITTGRNGGPIFVCRGGCTQDQVIEVLTQMGLWGKAPADGTYVRPRPKLPAPRITTQQERARLLEELLQAAEDCDADAPYIVVGEILEQAAALSYHAVSRVAQVLNQRSDEAQRHVDVWMSQRYPDAVFENQP